MEFSNHFRRENNFVSCNTSENLDFFPRKSKTQCSNVLHFELLKLNCDAAFLPHAGIKINRDIYTTLMCAVYSYYRIDEDFLIVHISWKMQNFVEHFNNSSLLLDIKDWQFPRSYVKYSSLLGIHNTRTTEFDKENKILKIFLKVYIEWKRRYNNWIIFLLLPSSFVFVFAMFRSVKSMSRILCSLNFHTQLTILEISHATNHFIEWWRRKKWKLL